MRTHHVPLEQFVFERMCLPADDQGMQRIPKIYTSQLAVDKSRYRVQAEVHVEREWSVTVRNDAVERLQVDSTLRFTYLT